MSEEERDKTRAELLADLSEERAAYQREHVARVGAEEMVDSLRAALAKAEGERDEAMAGKEAAIRDANTCCACRDKALADAEALRAVEEAARVERDRLQTECDACAMWYRPMPVWKMRIVRVLDEILGAGPGKVGE